MISLGQAEREVPSRSEREDRGRAVAGERSKVKVHGLFQ